MNPLPVDIPLYNWSHVLFKGFVRGPLFKKKVWKDLTKEVVSLTNPQSSMFLGESSISGKVVDKTVYNFVLLFVLSNGMMYTNIRENNANERLSRMSYC